MIKEKENSPQDIKVFIRILPMIKMCFDNIKISKDKKIIFARSLQQDCLLAKKYCVPNFWSFRTDGVLYNENQDDIYENVMGGVLNSVIEGNNAIILSYGQTGTGKTLTTSGLNYTFEDRGFAPRIISDLYALKEKASQDSHIKIRISYVEIRKDTISDLLKVNNNTLNANSLKFVYIAKPKNEFEALKLLFQAEGRRDIAENSPHLSHSAHGVLTIHLTITPCFISNPQRKRHKIHIVDLAAGDSLGNPASIWKNVKEIGNGNLAKSFLEQFLLVLSEKIPETIHCKRRLSILILYLSDALMFGNVIRVVGHIRIDKENLMTTISMLRFSQLVKGLPMFVHADKIDSCAGYKEDADLRQKLCLSELKALKMERDLNSMLMNTDLSTNITHDRKYLIEQAANKYLANEVGEILILNIADAKTAMRTFKNRHNNMKKEIEEQNKLIYAKALQDALEKLKQTGSKQSIGPAKKSKIEDDQMSTASSTRRRHSKLSNKNKRQSFMSTISEKSKGSKRGSMDKSLSSTIKSKEKSSEDAVKDLDVIPESLPTSEEAWVHYMTDEQFNYKEFTETKQSLEMEYMEYKREYLKELENLKQLTARHTTKMDDLTKMNMNMNFAQWKIYNAEGKLEELENSIRDLELEIANQRELVLKAQTELRITLREIAKAKSNILENYEEFCKTMYQLPYIASEHDIDINQEPIEEVRTLNDEFSDTSNKYNELMKYQVLQNEMKKQMAIRVRSLKKKKQWIKYF